MQIQTTRCGLLLLALISAPLHAPAQVPPPPAAASALGGTARPEWHRAVGTNQLATARLVEGSGIAVEWNQKLGTPLSVRGANLDQPAAWSGPRRRTAAASGSSEQRAIAVLDNLARLYQIREAGEEFRVKRTETDTLGFQHVRLGQVYQGLRVFGGELLVHFDKEGRAYQVNGEYVADIQPGLQPNTTEAEAVQAAEADLAGKGKPAGSITSGPELVIFALGAEPQLAYELTLSYEDDRLGPGEWRYWIGAADRAVLLHYDNVKRIAPPTSNGTNAPITGKRLVNEGGETVTFTGWYENTGYYYLRDTNLFFCIYNDGWDAGLPDNSTYANRGANDWSTSDPAAISAANNFSITQRYFRDVHGRRSYDNAGTELRVYVHSQRSTGWWPDHTLALDNKDGIWWGVLDTCCHEFTHGVVEYSAGLVYSGEPGALNESFADIFATCVEFHAQPDGSNLYPGKAPGTADWLLFEDCWTCSTALRDMRNPRNASTVGGSQATCGIWTGSKLQPSRYHGIFWDYSSSDNGGVHQNDGVQNFVFYLLSEGGTGTNDGIAYSVAGIGITNAEKVAYRALTAYCTSGTDYRAARTAWLSAAADLNTNWVGNVQAAWAAVRDDGVHHFEWTGMGLTQTTNTPFPVTVTAKDINNKPVTTFDGAVSLTAAMETGTVVFSDDFEDGDISDWTNDGGSYTRQVDTIGAAGTGRSVTLIGGNSSPRDGISRLFTNARPDRINFYVQTSASSIGGYFVALQGNYGSNSVIFFYAYAGGTLMLLDGPQNQYNTAYVPKQWYRVSFFLNWEAKTVDYYVNGSLVYAAVPFRDRTLTSIPRLCLYNFDNMQSWWDQIEFIQNPGTLPVSISPTITASFTNGVWTGSITVPQAATKLVLTASDGAGHVGSSNPFNVVGVPSLQIAATGSQVVLSWPVSASNYVLETSASLLPGAAWTPLTNGPAITGGSWVFTNTLPADTAFFRLRKP